MKSCQGLFPGEEKGGLCSLVLVEGILE